MKPATEILRRTLLAAACFGAAGLLVACADEGSSLDPAEVVAFDVRLDASVPAGTPEAPLPFATEPTPVTLHVEARRRDGRPATRYGGRVRVQSVPGRIFGPALEIPLVEGRASVDLGVQFAFGSTRLWVREVGEAGEETGVIGIGPPMHFAQPRVRNVRLNPDDPRGLSPLLGREARISEGVLMVTNVVANGFYLTDVGDRLAEEESGAGPWRLTQEPHESLFVFTFNFPDGIALGDRLCAVAGGVAEFQGQTQLTFPNYVVQGLGRQGEAPDEAFLDAADPGVSGRCPQRPDLMAEQIEVVPTALSPSLLSDNTAIRGWDSALVRIDGGVLSTRFDDCDFDGSGEIEGATELACRSRCQQDQTCTEMSSLRQFDQVSASVGGVAFEVADLGRAAGFDPLAGCWAHPGTAGDPADPPGMRCDAFTRRLRSITGTLRIVDLGGFVLKVLVPRFEQDLQFLR